jgi:transcriptional regulator with XRE-family HTH domain
MAIDLDRSDAILRGRFGAWLCSLREAQNLTQGDVAEKLGYTAGLAVSKIERGALFMQGEDIAKWAEILEIDVQDLGMRFMFYCLPDLYQAIYNRCPYELEGVERNTVSRKRAK